MSLNNRDCTQPPRSLEFLGPRPPQKDVANELAMLREEIKLLRDALNPPKSVLIVGADVERILRELK